MYIGCQAQQSAFPARGYAMTKNKEDIDVSQIIAQSPWFYDLPDEAKQTLVSSARIEHHPKDSFLYAAGDTSQKVHCLIEGHVRANLTSPQGQEFRLDEFRPNSWLGEAMLFSDERKVLSLQFKKEGMTISLQVKTVLALAEQHSSIYRNILKNQIERNRGMYRLMGGMLFYPLKSRLAWRILYFLKRHSVKENGGVYLDIDFTQQDLARLVFGSRQRVNKIFKHWSEIGLVVSKSKRYFIPNIKHLEKEASQTEK
jgi:CRP-like cAMP-binding protein